MRPIDADKLKQDLLDKSFYPAIVARAIDNASTVNPYEWISVEDRLPDWRDGKVLVFTQYGFSICERTTSNRWQGKHANWITHWMYLPSPPKKEG